jgi:transformation/transcription domain-associated protein
MQTLPTYSQLIDDAMRNFLRVLSETESQFISESTVQQLRKKTLEIIQRTTSILNSNYLSSEQRNILIRDILVLIYSLVEKENEENVIICLKIITDYHRLLKSLLNNEVKKKEALTNLLN